MLPAKQWSTHLSRHQNMIKRRIIFILGFFSTLPSSYFYGALGIFCVLSLTNILFSSFPRKHSLLNLIPILIIFALASFVGIAYGQSEAQRFLLRALFFVAIAFIYVASFDANDDKLYDSYLLGVFGGILLNSVAVLVFAINPEAYQALQIDNFSGYDKGARLFRSPGLQAGTDTAGFMSVFGIVLYLYLKQRQVISWFVKRKFFYLLLLTPLFCSRSSMLLGVITLIILLIVWRRMIRPVDKAIMMIYCALLLGVAIAFVGLLLFPELIGFLSVSTEIISGVPVDAIYAVSDGGAYVEQYDLYHLFTWIPIGDPLLYDNLLGKLLASMGVIGFVAGMLVVIYIFFGLLAIAPKREKTFILLFLFIFLFANVKNNYLFYPFFVSMISILFCRFSPSARALRPVYVKP